MSNQPRAAKILVSLVVSMTVAAAVLMALDSKSISAGAFSLASYSSLAPINTVITARHPMPANRWDRIEVFYSNTAGGNLGQLASLCGISSSDDLNFHFLVCNSLGDLDGQIEATHKWSNQWSALPGGTWYGSSSTIRICVVGQTDFSEYQLTRTAELIEVLCRKFDVESSKIKYPKNWQF